MPGLIDAHIHAYAADVNLLKNDREPPTLVAHFAAKSLTHMLARGFTSVRDTGGADYGLKLALDRGWIRGPRLFYCEKALSQSGGHGDFRPHHEHVHGADTCMSCGCGSVGHLAVVADGVDQVRKVVRENLRRGASFIKFTGSGGVSSTADPLDAIQYSDEEVSAIVDEVERYGVYCTAHIHPDRALKRAIKLGVHCIEHGTLIEPDTARMAADANTCIVPTMAIIAALGVEGKQLGYPPESLLKLDQVKDQAVSRMQYMKDAGVRIGFGTDLLGPLERHQCIEFSVRAAIFSPLDILRQATSVNAEILGMKGELGVIKEGALADLLVVEGDPTHDISVLAADGKNLRLIMRAGEIIRNELRGS